VRMAHKVLSYPRLAMPSVAQRYPHRNLHGRIVHTLGRRILRGDIRPGDALQAGTAMAASRTALREAIKVLAAKGLVEAKPKIGTRVLPRESWNLLDPDVMAWQHDGLPRPIFLEKLTEVRAVIEPRAAAFAARRADAPALAALESAFADMVAAARKPAADVDAFVEADMRFHLTILRAGGNDLLEQMARVVYSALVMSFRTTSSLPGSARRSLPKHRAILRAIVAGQPEAAEAAMARLVADTAREISRLPDGDGDGSTGRQDRDRNRRRTRNRPGDRGTAREGARAGHVLRPGSRRR
ncbi:MAG TPA: FadR/GntR family transcriptional regulator, partial [Vicinamibacterales bacterium]|nr:FadR/GntR family transcriptional regulator [Vicinamibacterales bacterium]